MTCTKCGEKPKKDCGAFPKAVIEIDNPEQITLMRKVVVPASMGDDTTVPPVVGKYHNVLLYYEANSKSYLYSSDGIPTQLVNGVTDYEQAVNLPQINGVTLLGDKSAADLELADAPMVITVAAGNTSWSGADTAEDVYNFFLNKGKVNIIFNGEGNYSYEIASAAYIPGEEKMMCTLAVATIATGEPTEFEGNALFGTMTLYTADKAIDVSQIELQPKLFVADFTGLDLNNNELSGVPATNATIGMVKPSDGLEVASDGTLSISDIEQYAHFFDTVADMKAATNLVAGDYAKTLGFHALNDGGGALYKIVNTGTANEMDVISVGNLMATLVNEVCNVKQIGAYGDNNHDDTDIFKYAIDNFKHVFVPIGQYVITDTLFISPNTFIEGEVSNTFFNGYEYGATIRYNSPNEQDPCFSFLGKDSDNLRHKDIYSINGSKLDDHTYESTISSRLTNINIVSSSLHNIGVVFAGCPNSELRVSCYGFKAGIMTSACWGSEIHNCFALCGYGIFLSSDNNGVTLRDSYFDCNNKNINIESDNLLYGYVYTSENVGAHQKNKSSGVFTGFVNNLMIRNVICEHFKIGFNFTGHSILTAVGLYGEGDDVFCATYTGNISITGVYTYAGNNSIAAFDYLITKLTVKNVYSTYDKLIKEENQWNERYGGYYIFEEVLGANIITKFDSSNPDTLYYDSSATTKEGVLGSPCPNIDTLFSMIGDGGTIVLQSDVVIANAGGSYKQINKNLTITSDDTIRTVSNNTTQSVIYPTRFMKDLTLKNVNIVSSTPSTPSDITLSSLFNPYTVCPKTFKVEDCTVDTTTYNGLLNADYNRNTVCDVVLDNVTFTNDSVLTTNHASGSSKILNINLYKQQVTGTPTIGTQTTIVSEYSN